MMNELEKSDSAIVAVKPANKAGQPAAEWVEPRAGTCTLCSLPVSRRTSTELKPGRFERQLQQGCAEV